MCDMPGKLPLTFAAMSFQDKAALRLFKHGRSAKLSNFILAKTEIKPAIVQIELRPYVQRKDFLKKCAAHNIPVFWEEIQRFNDWKPED